MSPDPTALLDTLIRARYPILAVPSYEEERVEATLARIAAGRDKRLHCWTVTRGLHEAESIPGQRRPGGRSTTDPLEALDEVMQRLEPAIYLFKDFHPYLGQPQVVRKLRDLAAHLKQSYKTLVLVSPRIQVPVELEKDVTLVEYPLPGLHELHQLLGEVVTEVNAASGVRIDPKQVAAEPILKAAQGLTLKEAENVFARAIVSGGRLTQADVPLILDEKRQIIRRNGMLEYFPVKDGFDSIGGLELLKDWLVRRRLAFAERAREFGLPFPKGVMLLGVQGCGKSLCAKAVSTLWQLPLLRFDVGRVFTSAVGASEHNMREAIQAAESVAPAILWIDEIEKAFSGVASSDYSDSGIASRVFGTFLTWLQEKSSPVFVIATANDVTRTPPELLRKGRLDELFFVDLPTRRERRDILAIHVAKRGRDPKSIDLDALAGAPSEGFSGAELEQAVISGLFEAFEQGSQLGDAHVRHALAETVPLSRTMSEKIDGLRDWASGRARPATDPADRTSRPGRLLET